MGSVGRADFGVGIVKLISMSLRNEAIANYIGPLCMACGCHAIARNDIVV
jgi:hypothetical protein